MTPTRICVEHVAGNVHMFIFSFNLLWQHDLEANVRVPLERKYRQFAEIFTGSYHFDNFQCSQ